MLSNSAELHRVRGGLHQSTEGNIGFITKESAIQYIYIDPRPQS